jgi:hypothetical protein
MSFQLHEWDIHIVCCGMDGAGVADIRFHVRAAIFGISPPRQRV